ncbi:YceI family protein [Devriesea agamarum]|uniref:YceI family protein n=1 Tax=Devriesea agamarum TaxID=472569 RepID=UPI00071CA763|nr:YceI family protein [Devriesea agamarum]
MTALPTGLTAGRWTLDAAHTEVGFSVRHAGISKTRGSFRDVTGTLTLGTSLQDSQLDATVQIASIDTGNTDRDNHLRGEDFFDAEQFPTMTFHASAIDDSTLAGELSIHGVTRDITFTYEFLGATTDPFGAYRAGFEATATISRKDFGLTWNAALEAGGVLVGDKVTIQLSAEFVAPTAS